MSIVVLLFSWPARYCTVLGVNTCIQKIGDVGMPQQVRCHIEVQAIHNVGIVFLMSSQTRLNSVLDALSVHILIIGTLLGRPEQRCTARHV